MGNAKNTKNKILLAAIAVISKKGYHQASMDEIALEANVAKGTLYYYFKSKEEVFNLMIMDGIVLIKGEIIKKIEGVDDPVLQLRILTQVLMQLFFDRRNLFKIIISQLWGQELRQVELRKEMDIVMTFIESFIQNCVSLGKLETKNTTLKAYNYFGILCTTAVYYLIKTECDTVDDAMIDTIMTQI
jgi:AcrR family transcriptional regulator